MLLNTASRAVLFMVLATASAHAAAITYSGTIGDEPVLMEITEAADGPFIGRLTRLADGVDIPLQPLSISEDGMEIAEELSCIEASCLASDNGIFDPPLGPRLTLAFEGQDAVGLWSNGAQEQEVRLTPVGKRAYERYDTFAFQEFVWKSYGEPLTPNNSPYDYLKMQVPLIEGPAVDMGLNMAIRMMSDPRTKFAFPRLSPMRGGPDTTVINDALQAMHWETNMRGFNCLSMAYLSAGWSETAGKGIGTLGNVDEEQAVVNYVSAALISFVQSGSLYCAGSAPYNHIDYVTLDVETGEPFDLSRVFLGWVPTQDGVAIDLATARGQPMRYSWGPDEALVAFLRERVGPEAQGCNTADEIAGFLDISFDEGGVAVFRIAGLDGLELVCEGPFFSAPLTELRELLTPEAAEIFPELGD